MDLDDEHEFARDAELPAQARTLWHGRFTGGPSESLLAYTVSLPYDQRMWRDDIAGSKAHVRGLARVGLLSEDERDTVLAALDDVSVEMDSGTFLFVEGDEDIHTAIERRVTELAGAAGGKLHTARSRNDQVATDLRLWCKRELRDVALRLIEMQEALLNQALEAGDTYLPGYTHLQRAQPVLLSHHLMAHGWALGRDVSRLLDTLQRLDVSPLGAGALAGSSLPIDPEATAADLGFAKAFDNSLDAVSDRDFVAEAVFDLAMIGIHLSRIGEEWVLWTSGEFGFAVLDDGYATGSSMLPQKKNPDIAELIRGRTATAIGHLTALVTMQKGLPLTYNRDLQEDKEPVFDAAGTLGDALEVMAGAVATLHVQTARMRAAADDPLLLATDLAEVLVREGVPFRKAHEVVGRLVSHCLEKDLDLRAMAEEDLRAFHPAFPGAARALISLETAVEQRRATGATARERVLEALARAERTCVAEAEALGLGESRS